MADLTIGGLAGEEAGEGTPVVLLHGLTATRRYVVMGSKNLERSGHRVVAYDARGHGRSQPAPEPDAYAYADLATDLLAVLDDRGIERPVLAGASMGAHTIVAHALRHPDRVAALVLITPAFDPEDRDGGLGRWDRLSQGLRDGGVEGFVEAYGEPRAPEPWRDTIRTVLRQRLSAHEHPEAVADALRAVPRSRAVRELGRPRADRGPGDRRREPRRARPGASVRDRRAIRRDPARCAPRVRGAGQVTAGLAGGPALANHRRGRYLGG